MAASSPLHTAMACRVPRWFCTARRLRMVSSAWCGRTSRTWGRTVRKYGALRANITENARLPSGVAYIER